MSFRIRVTHVGREGINAHLQVWDLLFSGYFPGCIRAYPVFTHNHYR